MLGSWGPRCAFFCDVFRAGSRFRSPERALQPSCNLFDFFLSLFCPGKISNNKTRNGREKFREILLLVNTFGDATLLNEDLVTCS